MKKQRSLAAAAVILAAAVVVKLYLPELPRQIGQQFGLGETRRRTAEAVEVLGSGIRIPKNAETPSGFRVEEAVSVGEFAPEPEHPAVAAFLEQQAEFASVPPPEGVDYGFYELPFDYTVPVAGYTSSGFGYRVHPILKEVKFHFGTDFAANAGEDVCAFADGTVSFAGSSDSFGNYITVDHGGGWISLYAHCSYLYVHTGQSVNAGEKIALVGATGHVTGPHLHFELTHDGVYLNPEYYFNA